MKKHSLRMLKMAIVTTIASSPIIFTSGNKDVIMVAGITLGIVWLSAIAIIKVSKE